MPEEFKRTVNSQNTCYNSVQNLLFSCLLLKYIKIKIHRIIIFVPSLIQLWILRKQTIYFRLEHQTPQNKTSGLHMQPLPHFINSIHFIIQQSTALCNFNML
jgi:hypothetical protein